MRGPNAAIFIGTLLAVFVAPQHVMAEAFEQPPSVTIEQTRGFWPSGDNYTITNPVRSDGLLRIYTVTTPYGEYTVHGDQMLRLRLSELAALHELEKVERSESYAKALLDAGLNPIKYTGRLIIDPKKTVTDTMSGIGSLFGRISSDISNIGKTPGDPISGLLGVTDQRRKLATKIGVDPYTDFPPLDARLNQLAQAAAAGGLTVSAAMLAAPATTVGLVFSNLGTAGDIERARLEEVARDQTVSQIFDMNREKLRAMGAPDDMIEALLANRNYTPVDMAALVAALETLSDVENRIIFLRRASHIDSRSLAFFMRRHAEMVRNHQIRGANFTRFVSFGGYPFLVTRDGRLVGVVPFDSLSWTTDTAAVWRQCAEDARQDPAASRVALLITGSATPLARRQFKALGWRLIENAKF